MSDAVTRTPETSPGPSYPDELARAQLVALNRQGRVSNFVPPVNALILAGMLWGEVSDALLVGWVGIVWLSSALRVSLYRRFDAALTHGRGS